MLLSIVTSDELLANISRKLQDTRGSAKLIATITGMKVFEGRAGIYNPENKAYRVVLIDYQDPAKNQLAQQLFRNQCSTNGIAIDHETRYSADMKLFRVTIDNLEEMELVRKFEGVRYIEESRPILIDTDSLDDESIPAVKKPKEGESYPTIGVLDSGSRRNAYLAPWLLDQSEEYYEEELQDKGHGSMVASVLEYSDELNGTDYASTDGIMMLEAVIIPNRNKESVYAEDLLENIRDAIQRHRDIKIWTMSVGTNEECALDSFSEYGMALGNIADENGVLIIKSAGNNTIFDHGVPMPRIAKMADSVRALVIGSIAGEKGQYDMADINAPSPFSRRGPGPQYVIKPDLVAYGGNAGRNPEGKITTNGIRVFSESGILSSAAGTSFSTPGLSELLLI